MVEKLIFGDLKIEARLKAEDIARLEASIDRYGKQVARQKEEMNRWAKRYRDALRSVEALRSESHLKKSHMMKINIIYIDENRQCEKIMQLSAEIIQQNYLLLRSMGRLDNVMLEKMERLVKLDHCQRGVKFTDDDDQGELMKEVNITDTSIEEITNLSDCYDGGADDMEMDCGVKRLKDDDGESEPEHDFKKHKYEANMAEFKKPKALRPLNFKPQSLSVKTTVTRKTPTKAQKTTTIAQFKVPKLMISGPSKPSSGKKQRQQAANSSTSSNDASDASDGPDENVNSTFCIDSAQSTANSLFSNVLVESNVDPQVLNKVLRRASTKGNVISKVTLTLNKENRKFSPKRVGKSPRPLIRANSRSAHSTAASVISRYRMMKAGAVSSSSSTTAKLTATTPKKGLKSTYDSDGERKAPPRLTKK
ncbi:kinesin heavy chain [Culex quinquefasciatus]|uniref:Kinesin heavy chain n=1 Tax=Culex quinquefasciatus TaxID=7176 RepID=B0WC76_CULQU|nr:kinesin heavy chain [Culex quinquefasciatus]|eukprot:XP_001846310.1 kinesin heavy chain [Culex quinquefasciatus]